MDNSRYKFRAWHKESKEILYPVKQWHLFGWLEDEKQPIEIMQYTGLKDKNGKEIYEGDIVQNKEKENYRVAWNINGLWSYKRTSDNASFMQDYWEAEVIGNIYENPELLEGEK